MKALVPKSSSSGQRSLQVVHTYLERGGGFYRSVWVKTSPRNPVLKLILVPPLLVTTGLVLLLVLLILGFTLMALVLFSTLVRQKQAEENSATSELFQNKKADQQL